MGHDLLFFGPDESCFRSDQTQALRFTRPNCKRMSQNNSEFAKVICDPREFPKPQHWYHLRRTQQTSVPRLVKLWKWGKKQVEHIDQLALRPSKCRTVARTDTVPPVTESSWFQDLTECGDIESQPGPRVRHMKKLQSLDLEHSRTFPCLACLDGPG